MYLMAKPHHEWFLLVDDDTFIFHDALLYLLDQYRGQAEDNDIYGGNFSEQKVEDDSKLRWLYGAPMAFGGGGLFISRHLLHFLVEEGDWIRECVKLLVDVKRIIGGDAALYRCLHDIIPAIAPSHNQTFLFSFSQEKALNQMDVRGRATDFFEGIFPFYPPATLHHLPAITYFETAHSKKDAIERLWDMATYVPFYLCFQPFLWVDGKYTWVIYYGYSIRVYHSEGFSPERDLRKVKILTFSQALISMWASFHLEGCVIASW